ncbi:MAG: hypothetical protein HUJ68_03045 [Clostridia bacterium]|nr:hypothetical protein [Clostridia bacterium]
MNLTFIIMVALIIYLVAICATWNSLSVLNNERKIILIIVQIILVYVITLIVYVIGNGGINYPSIILKTSTRRVLVPIFSGINSILIIPIISKQINLLHDNEITKEKFKKRIIILMLAFAILLMFENSYMINTQKGIIDIFNKNK